MSVDPEKHKFLFRAGIVLLALNVPLGWGGGAFCVFFAGWTRDKNWLTAALWVYGCSWLILGLGFLLAGRSGWQIARIFWRRRRRLQLLRHRRARRRLNAPPP